MRTLFRDYEKKKALLTLILLNNLNKNVPTDGKNSQMMPFQTCLWETNKRISLSDSVDLRSDFTLSAV